MEALSFPISLTRVGVHYANIRLSMRAMPAEVRSQTSHQRPSTVLPHMRRNMHQAHTDRPGNAWRYGRRPRTGDTFVTTATEE